MTYISLTPLDLAVAAILIFANGAISIAFRLGLERTIAIAIIRAVIQLSLVGYLLKLVFAAASPMWTAVFALVMLAAAGHDIVSRQERRITLWQAYVLSAGAPFLAGLLATFFALVAVIGAEPWYGPRYLIPLLGMMLGNALSGVALVLDTITSSAVRERVAIEARLAMGATRYEALQDILRRGLKTGMMPILSLMATSGLVSLPGMMTGQILAGADPLDASRYQIMILFLIAGATGLAVLAAGLGAVALLTDKRHRLRLDRLSRSDAVK